MKDKPKKAMQNKKAIREINPKILQEPKAPAKKQERSVKDFAPVIYSKPREISAEKRIRNTERARLGL